MWELKKRGERAFSENRRSLVTNRRYFRKILQVELLELDIIKAEARVCARLVWVLTHCLLFHLSASVRIRYKNNSVDGAFPSFGELVHLKTQFAEPWCELFGNFFSHRSVHAIRNAKTPVQTVDANVRSLNRRSY